MFSESSYLKPGSGKHNPLPSRGIIVMKWDASADQHLLLAILNAHKVTVDHVKVAGMMGCTPRACEERLKKLRKLSKGWALGDNNEKDSERARGGKNVNRKQRKKGTEKGQAVGRDGNGLYETLGDIPSPGQEVAGSTGVDIPAVKENAPSKAGLGYQDLYSEDEELTPTPLLASSIKRDPSFKLAAPQEQLKYSSP